MDERDEAVERAVDRAFSRVRKGVSCGVITVTSTRRVKGELVSSFAVLQITTDRDGKERMQTVVFSIDDKSCGVIEALAALESSDQKRVPDRAAGHAPSLASTGSPADEGACL